MPRYTKRIYQLRALNKSRQRQSEPEISNDTNIVSEDVNISNISESSIDINTVPENASSAVGVTESSESTDIIDADTPNSNIASESTTIIDADTPDNCNSNITSGNTTIIDTDTPDNCNVISKSNTNIQKKRTELVDRIKSLPDDEVIAACHLFNTMTYSDGRRETKLLSPYLINKAKTFIMESSGQHHTSIKRLQRKVKLLEKENRWLRKKKEITNSRVHLLTMKVVKGEEAKTRYIRKMRSIIRKKRDISPEQFKKGAEKLIKENKKEYTPQFIQLVTELSNTGVISISSTVECTRKLYTFLTGKEPDKWISRGTISRWNQETTKLFVWKSLVQAL